MFDPSESVRLRDEVPDEPLLANLAGITQPQRTALVSLGIGGVATCPVPSSRKWIVPSLGTGWAIDAITIRALQVEGLVNVSNHRARLTRRGMWYARTAAYREAEQRAAAELEKM